MIESRPGDAFQPGDLLNNTYRIEALLGRGGTSNVYKARNEISGRLAALKVLKAEFSGNEDFLVLLTREEEMREIRHDAVVRYSENHRTPEGLVYLVMDYVEGPGLDKKLKQAPVPAEDVLTICRRVAEGLQAAHERNIVHRDLSPDNIILRGGDPAQAVIIDFGIAKDTNPGAETIVGNEFAGKYSYAAPEQLSGHTDARSDIYSLGALLLAAFRGAPPDVGSNPMEVVQKKSDPLDTNGVPEPLKTLIDRMTAPDPADRFQSAAEVLAYLDAPGGTVADDDDDATVIAPVARKAAADRARTEAPPRPAEPAAAPPKKSRGGLVALVAVVLLAAAGAGGYFTGLFDRFLGPAYPAADPFTLIAEQPAEGPARAVGYVPAPETREALTALMARRGGTAELTLASGDIAESWGPDVMAALEPLDGLEEWRLVVNGNQAQLTGRTSDKAVHDRLAGMFGDGLPGGLEGRAEITLQPVFLAADEVQAVLTDLADCGPLQQADVPQVGYGPTTPITVSGRVAETATRVQLFDRLRAIGGDRKVVLDVEVLNPALCLIESHLPDAPPGGIDVAFSMGDTGEPNPSGRFFVGENPVIDVILPPDVTGGYLTVSVLDVSGNVFHLLPNLNRQDNAVASLRGAAPGEVPVRVAYSLDEAAANGGLAFRVDDSSLGKSKIIVLHSTEPLFDGLRPTSESAAGYARALQEFAALDGDRIQSLDSQILVTARP